MFLNCTLYLYGLVTVTTIMAATLQYVRVVYIQTCIKAYIYAHTLYYIVSGANHISH